MIDLSEVSPPVILQCKYFLETDAANEAVAEPNDQASIWVTNVETSISRLLGAANRTTDFGADPEFPSATLEEQVRDKKVLVYKFKRRKGYRRKQGHRQQYSLIKVQKITA